MKKIIYIGVGIAAMVLGAVGTVIPGLPTTPFLLLALFCFTKGSQKLNDWFRGTRLYVKYVKHYEHDRSLTRRQKLTIQATAGFMMFISFLLTENVVIRLVLISVFFLHNYVFIFVIKTRQADRPETTRKELAGDKYEL